MALISVEELQAFIFNTIGANKTSLNSENINIINAIGRVLAEDVISPVNVPYANVSAMDGYAFTNTPKAGSRWKVAGVSAAGHAFSGSLNKNECVRIMTGAVVPHNCITVEMQENIEIVEENCIILKQDAKDKNHIRYAGEEITKGATVLTRGRILREADILLLASLGLGDVSVFRKIRVAIMSTGDELREPNTPLTSSDQIYDSNRYMLMARLQKLPVEIIDLGKINDELDSVKNALQLAAQSADVLITSGGVSVGDFDYLKDAVETLGKIHHYKVAMKPGKPFVFGQLGAAWYFGLPGNPVSGFVGLDMFVQSALWQLCGANDEVLPQPLRLNATLTVPIKKAVGRADIQRAILTQHANGSWTVAPSGSQDSHRVLGISQANAYMILPRESGSLSAGETVVVQPFTETFL